ncbi:hypothetical protein [Marinobacterium stanieri]|uniref:Uncharacterized protein n=1 Tax=Marinobacterium stanieri TaxID=49186 RepID=A0A1N6Q3X8_9GAMM|nr:hypothetical protein [Marinobacterium stanieri]SIQ11245.1 hypothetical protein SAMN05421647_102235 [Marinobacterium stanieri]
MSSNGGITGEQFSRFLASKGVGDDCPTCGLAAGLSIPVNDPSLSGEGKAPAVRVVRRLEEDPRLGYGELMQVCGNCGFIRYFRDAEILAFLQGEDKNEL